MIAFLLLVLYSGLMAAYILAERQVLRSRLSAMDDLHVVEDAFERSSLAVSNALLALRQLPPGSDDSLAAREATPFALEIVEQSLHDLRPRYPNVLAQYAVVQRNSAALAAQPGPANLIELRDALAALEREVSREGARAREQRRAMGENYRERSDRIAITALSLGVAGLVLFGAVATAFFARLAADLGLLERRASEIVSGYRGDPLEVTRRDEVGRLTRAVNRMAVDLAHRETEVALAREQRAHAEKMVALGTLANNLAHEIGNPLAAIAALSQSGGGPGAGDSRAGQADLILEQTRRIAAMTRQISEFADQRSNVPQPVDVGGMARTVCEFMGFDPRFRGTRIDARVSPDLPAIVAAPGDVSAILMNLLLFSIEGEAPARPAQLALEADAGNGAIAIRVRGGGAPRPGARLDHTRHLVEKMGGQLFADEVSDAMGCRITLPLGDAMVRT